MHACQLNDVHVDKRGIRGVCTPANLMTFGSQQRGMRGLYALHACQLNDVHVDKRGIRGVCTPANLMTFGSQQRGMRGLYALHACQLNDVHVDKRGIRGVCTPANLMMFLPFPFGEERNTGCSLTNLPVRRMCPNPTMWLVPVFNTCVVTLCPCRTSWS